MSDLIPPHDAQAAAETWEARRKRGEVRTAQEASRENHAQLKSAYEDGEPPSKPDPKPSSRTYPTATTAAQARRESEQRMRDGYARD